MKFNIDMAKNVFKRMAIEMTESTERAFLSSHPSSAEPFMVIDKVTETLKAGLDPLKVFAPQESQKSEEK